MICMSFLPKVACSAVLVAAATLSLAPAADAGVLLTGPGSSALRNNGDSNFGGSIGYSFTVDVSGIVVTSLGVYDAPGNSTTADIGTIGDGLEHQAPIAMFDADQNVLATVNVPTGNDAGTLIGEFRYIDLDLEDYVTLTQGETYYLMVGVVNVGNGFLGRTSTAGNGATYHAGFTHDRTRWANSGGSSSVSFPTNSGTESPFVGPNFQYVPEPASLALVGLGGLMMAGRGRRAIG